MCNVSRVALAVKWELYDRVLVITATIGSKIWRIENVRVDYEQFPPHEEELSKVSPVESLKVR